MEGPRYDLDYEDFDATGVLAALEDTLVERRSVEFREITLALCWADLHASDPRDDPVAPGTRRDPLGGDILIATGGDGTPMIRDLCVHEFGLARRTSAASARALICDSLDLRHRLPHTWLMTRAGECEVWLARKIASLTRELDRHQVIGRGPRIAPMLGSNAPGKVLRVLAGLIIDADPAAHQARVEAAARARYLKVTATDEHGLRLIIARVNAGDGAWFDAMTTRIADVLTTRPDHTRHLGDHPSRDVLRAEAISWYTRPAELLQLLLEAETVHDAADDGTDGRQGDDADVEDDDQDMDHDEEEPEPPVEERPSRTMAVPAHVLDTLKTLDLTRMRPKVDLHVHLHADHPHAVRHPRCRRRGRCRAGRGARPDAPDPGQDAAGSHPRPPAPRDRPQPGRERELL